MSRFMSDRRVLAASAAIITVAILAFLVGTYPTWRMAIGLPDGSSSSGAPVALAEATSPKAQPQGEQRTVPVAVAPTQGVAATQSVAPAATQSVPGPATQDVAARSEPKPASQPDDAGTSDGTAGVSPSSARDVAGLQPAELSDAGAVADATADKPADAGQGPSFDIVRVEPSGDSVVAARAQPGAEIVLLDQGQPIARAKADANGQVAFLPPALVPGEHSLMLSVGDPKAPGALSSQSVAVSISAQVKTAPLVALIAPGQPTKILSGQASPALGSPKAPAGSASNTPDVAVSSIDVEELGGVYATGKATPDSHCRVYLNGSFVATVTAGKDGTWSLKIKRGMRPGRYTVRVDQLQSAAGQVQARAEVPFDYPARLTGVASLLRPKANGQIRTDQPPRTSAPVAPAGVPVEAAPTTIPAPSQFTADVPKPATGPNVQIATAGTPAIPSATDPTVVAQLLTTKVVHGDSLWRISRKMLGHGMRYTQIYAANTTQIRNPKLIYPGQIFVMPQTTP